MGNKIRVNRSGHVQNMMEGIVAAYKKKNPGRECRFVYAPEHKRELSKVISRQAQGYRKVTVAEVGLSELGGKEDDVVRIGDTILMSIEADTKAAQEVERAGWAADEAKRIKNEYYESQESTSFKNSQGGQEKGSPIGDVKIEEREFEFDVRQEE